MEANVTTKVTNLVCSFLKPECFSHFRIESRAERNVQRKKALWVEWKNMKGLQSEYGRPIFYHTRSRTQHSVPMQLFSLFVLIEIVMTIRTKWHFGCLNFESVEKFGSHIRSGSEVCYEK